MVFRWCAPVYTSPQVKDKLSKKMDIYLLFLNVFEYSKLALQGKKTGNNKCYWQLTEIHKHHWKVGLGVWIGRLEGLLEGQLVEDLEQ